MKKYFIFLILFFSFKIIHAQTWNPIGSGMDDDIYSLCEYNGDLYAGGKFLNADGNSANHIAIWDGANWLPVAQGLNGTIWAMIVYNGELYVGGVFSDYGYGIARWNGTSWNDVGGGTTGSVYAFCIYNGKLCVGGTFLQAGSVVANSTAEWDGTSWSALGMGVDGVHPNVLALATFNGRLIVGGEFTSAGGQPSRYVSSWNDTAWIPMGPTVTTENWPHGIYSLCAFQNKLYAGGAFDTIGLTHVTNNIAAWNGTSWNQVALSINSYIYAMVANSSKLYIGGFFSSPGSRITAWNGSVYSNLGTGMNNNVNALTFYNGSLYAGGRFTMASAHTANKIAWWSVPLSTDELSDQSGISIYPNPTDGNMTFDFPEMNAENGELGFYNSLGQLVDVIRVNANEKSISVNETALENGVYFYQLMINGEMKQSGKFAIAK